MLIRESMNEFVKQKLDAYVASQGLRQTKQRNKLVEEIFSSAEHFTIEELLERLRKTDVRASRATVYRTVKLLVEAQMLFEIDLGEDVTTYDPNFMENPVHNHLVCVDCGKVVEFEDNHLELLNDCLSRRMGFRPVKKSLRIEACCEKLRSTGMCASLIEARVNQKRLPNQRK